MDARTMLRNCLTEMSVAAKMVNESNYRDFLDRFNTLILGERLNVVFSLEVFHYLKRHRGLDVATEEFTELIPAVCRELGMKSEALIALGDVGKDEPPIIAYQISLF